jgi:hypothetical protein
MFLITAGSSFKNISESENCCFQVWEDWNQRTDKFRKQVVKEPVGMKAVI